MQNQTLSSCLRCALPVQNCLCKQFSCPALPISCHIILHPREVQKANSTGRLLSQLGLCTSSTWHRTHHHTGHILTNTPEPAYLLHPQGEPAEIIELNHKATFIVLDGTWQQTAKMLRQDPCLNSLPRISLSPAKPSMLYLRRNQPTEGLSTLESLATLLECLQHSRHADCLMALFAEFQRRHLAARSQGYYNLCTPI